MNHFKLNRFSRHLQVSFSRLNAICRSLYKLYAPDELKHRRNVDQVKLSDSSILALLIWQAEIGSESQRRFCSFFVGLSHSRFNRRARMPLPLIRCIRQAWNQGVNTTGELLIIDIPVPLCQPVRNYRVKIFRGIADIGYKATKNLLLRLQGPCNSKRRWLSARLCSNQGIGARLQGNRRAHGKRSSKQPLSIRRRRLLRKKLGQQA